MYGAYHRVMLHCAIPLALGLIIDEGKNQSSVELRIQVRDLCLRTSLIH